MCARALTASSDRASAKSHRALKDGIFQTSSLLDDAQRELERQMEELSALINRLGNVEPCDGPSRYDNLDSVLTVAKGGRGRRAEPQSRRCFSSAARASRCAARGSTTKWGRRGVSPVDRDDVLRGQHAGAAERDSVQAEGADSEDGDAPNLRYARSAQAGHLETRLAPSAAVEWT